MLASGGFDPAADIVGVTVNRWPLGYAYTYDTLSDPDVAPLMGTTLAGLRAALPRPVRRRNGNSGSGISPGARGKSKTL